MAVQRIPSSFDPIFSAYSQPQQASPYFHGLGQRSGTTQGLQGQIVQNNVLGNTQPLFGGIGKDLQTSDGQQGQQQNTQLPAWDPNAGQQQQQSQNPAQPIVDQNIQNQQGGWGYTDAQSGQAVNTDKTGNQIRTGANLAGTVGNYAAPGVGTAVGAYYGKYGSDAYSDLKSDTHKTRGAATAALLATGPFLGWAAPFVKPIDQYFGSGKDDDQMRRDSIKSQLRDRKMVTDDWGIKTPNGEYELRDNPEYWTPDTSKAYSTDIKALADPLAFALTNGDQTWQQYSGWLSNAAMDGTVDFATAKQRLLWIAKNTFGMKPSQILDFIQKNPGIDEDTKKGWTERITSSRKKGGKSGSN